ncbi:MAG TPA: ferrochelatase [Xanthomonadaceae bacterium]|nr:ferrochelatase [Xanthomonadaceae bacterium]
MPAEPARSPASSKTRIGAPRAALVLVNLGTPTAPTPEAVRRYLLEFLSDRRVVQLPPLLWQPLLRAVVLPRRCGVVADKYAQIWMEDGSPLAVYTQRLVWAVQERLDDVRVVHAMRYGEPALAGILHTMREEQYERVLVLPLYPQYSTTTTASVGDVVSRSGASVRMVEDYHRDPGWVEAVAGSIRAHWAAHGRGERLVFSFHGIPQRLVDGGDPYAAQCEASTAAIAQALGIERDEVLLTYQSRFGRERWLQPYTLPTLQALAREGVRSIDIACPGFAVDCLETLEEIAMQNAEAFHAAGGHALRYIACLNDSPAHADALAALAQRQLAAWPSEEKSA